VPTDEELQRLADRLAVADAARESDLVALQEAGFDEAVAEEWAANPEPDPDTDGMEH
jgi:hypothetical protein